MKSGFSKLAFCLFALFATGSFSQNFEPAMPNLFDPSAREQVLDLAGVPAIRFLSSADFPPFNYRSQGGELIGFNIDLANAICENLQVGCTMQAWPWEQVGDALADFQGDALIAGLAINRQNGMKFDFSQIYLMLPARFVTLKPRSIEFDLNHLEDKTIGVRKGSGQYEFARRYLPNVLLVQYESELAALAAVADNQIFAYFGDGLRASIWLNQNSSCCAFAGEAYFNAELFGQGLAIAFAPGQDQMRRAIDIAISRLKRDGTLDELYLRWFPIGFY